MRFCVLPSMENNQPDRDLIQLYDVRFHHRDNALVDVVKCAFFLFDHQFTISKKQDSEMALPESKMWDTTHPDEFHRACAGKIQFANIPSGPCKERNPLGHSGQRKLQDVVGSTETLIGNAGCRVYNPKSWTITQPHQWSIEPGVEKLIWQQVQYVDRVSIHRILQRCTQFPSLLPCWSPTIPFFFLPFLWIKATKFIWRMLNR